MKKINFLKIAACFAAALTMIVSCAKEEKQEIKKELSYKVGSEKVMAGVAVTFSDLSIGVESRTWTFQDGTPSTSTDASVSVTFASMGSKACSLKVIYKDKTEETANFTVEVFENLAAEIAVAGLTPKGCAKKGAEISFSLADVKGNPTSYAWTFPGGTPATSTDAAPKVVWNDQINDVEVSVVVTRASDGATLTLTQNIIAGNYPCFRVLDDYDSYSFEKEKFGGWTAWTGAGKDMGTNTDAGFLTLADDGACGTAHSMKINTDKMNFDDYGQIYDGQELIFADLFSRNNWVCNAHIEKGKKYELVYWTKRTADLDPLGIEGLTNETYGYAFVAVVLRNNLNDWDYNSTLDVQPGTNWETYFPEIPYAQESDMAFFEHWYDDVCLKTAPADGWVKNTIEFTSNGDYHNVYPYFRVMQAMNWSPVYLDEVQINLIEE